MVELHNRLTAEALGTALLPTIVIGPGIMVERLAGKSAAIVLLANMAATVGGLYMLIEALGPIGGAHFSPVVNAVMAVRGELHGVALLPYAVVQVLGAVLGVWLAHAMLGMTLLQFSTKVRSGTRQWITEAVVTVSLLLVILRTPNGRAASIVAAYIDTVYWFTASTSLANPATAFGRMFSNSFADIAPNSVPGFMLTECADTVLGVLLHSLLEPRFATTGHPSVVGSSDEHPPHT